MFLARESRSLRFERKVVVTVFHQTTNIYEAPIVYKYREGKFKRTLTRELKENQTMRIEV